MHPINTLDGGNTHTPPPKKKAKPIMLVHTFSRSLQPPTSMHIWDGAWATPFMPARSYSGGAAEGMQLLPLHAIACGGVGLAGNESVVCSGTCINGDIIII